jgi:hypothetical protein
MDVTSHYATHLRTAAARPASLLYFQKHYQWDATCFDTVDWKAHHGAIQKLRFGEKAFITKWIHQNLPMVKVFKKIDPTQSITCSSCKRQPECEAHLYKCPACKQGMDMFISKEVADFLQANHTCPALAYILLNSLQWEVHGQYPAFQQRHGIHQPEFRVLLQAQTNLGWSQLFQGRLVTNWGRLQEQFLEQNQVEL